MKYWIWLATLETLNPIQKKKLLDIYKSPQNIYDEKIEELSNLKFLKKSNIVEISKKRDMTLITKYEEYMKKHNIYMLNIADESYPENLKNIYDAPISLFLKGNINLLNEFSIAIIGCREASKYGLNIAQDFAYQLTSKNIVVVSGMAKGIDGAAHRGALKLAQDLNCECKTIAVLGSGVDFPYPAENIDVYKKILSQGGLIVSEYVVGTKPIAANFPKRNRIISALSSGLLVVEAKKKSGTMITVDFALEQGKNVYIVPGNINSLNSEGTNDLIKQGAKLVSSVSDILEDF